MPTAKAAAAPGFPASNTTDAIREKRNALLKEIENEVNAHLGLGPLKPGEVQKSWTGRECLYDLVLYETMNAMGIRVTEIKSDIKKQLSLLLPN